MASEADYLERLVSDVEERRRNPPVLSVGECDGRAADEWARFEEPIPYRLAERGVQDAADRAWRIYTAHRRARA